MIGPEMTVLGRVAFRGTAPRIQTSPTHWTSTFQAASYSYKANFTRRFLRPNRGRPGNSTSPFDSLAEKQKALPDFRLYPEARTLYKKDSSSTTYLLLDPNINREPFEKPSTRPMKYSYQVLSTPTADTPGSTIVLQYEGKRYLFGHVAEGTQRTIIENGVSVAHLTQLFITGKTTWSNNGGLMGMILTLADSWASSMTEPAKKSKKGQGEGPQRLTIHAGKNVNHVIATARRFIFRKHVPVTIHEYDSTNLAREPDASGRKDVFEKPTWADENIKVWAMALRPSYEKHFERTSGFKSPRKRNLNEFEERDELLDSDIKPNEQLLRQHIVKDMFDSTWSLDALHEELLANVKLPAAIFVRNTVTKDLERYTGPLPGGTAPVPDIKVLVRKPWPAAQIERLPATSPSTESMCYFVRSEEQRGKFDLQKATALGVPKGPAFADLASGKSYTKPDGKVITSDMVLGPPRRGKTVAILDIPSEFYIDDLIEHPLWQSPAATETLTTIFWILGPGVGEDSRIADFVSRMKHCDHIVSGTDYCPNSLRMLTAAKSTLRLSKINPDNFPVPVHDNLTIPQGRSIPGATKANPSTQKLPWMAAQPGLTVEMEPKYFVNKDAVIPMLDTRKFVTRLPKAVKQRLSAIQKRLKHPDVINKVLMMREDLPPLAVDSEVVTLGTGSSSPSKYRNVSATLLHVPDKGYYLFDCGENTLGQLKRVYGAEKLREVMENLRVIWVSHLHADHHLGAVAVIREWYEVNYGSDRSGSRPAEGNIDEILSQKRLCVISDSMFIQWLEEYASVEDYGFDKLLPLAITQTTDKVRSTFLYRHMQADGTVEGPRLRTTELRFNTPSSQSSLLQALTGLKNVRAVFVNHCRAAMAVTLEWDDDFQVSYSGDCRPSKQFAEIGRKSTLLIHEATFQDDLRGQAVAKKHSTAAEAIEVGRLMEAKMLLLTHFSQRYAKISKLDDSNRHIPELADGPTPTKRRGTLDVPDSEWPGDGGLDLGSNDDVGLSMTTDSNKRPRKSPMPVCMAFDYMRVKIRDMPIAQMFSPAFEKLIERLEQVADEEAFAQKEKDALALQAKASKKSKKLRNDSKDEAKSVELPTRSGPMTEPSRSAWSASESEEGWSDNEGWENIDDDEPIKWIS